jgi:uncharacterized YigZ family protein
MQDSYLTISKTSEGFYKEKGSKFLAFAFPVSSEEEVKNQLDALRKTYYDARHHCYAYTCGTAGEHYRANDDGEPGHSAGDPILGQIRSRELTNTLVVVIRYFGGTKLGVSGLINAYKTAAAEALDANQIVKKEITAKLLFTFPYEETNAVMKLVKDFDLTITDQGYAAECTLEANVVISALARLEGKVDLMQKTGSAINLKTGPKAP